MLKHMLKHMFKHIQTIYIYTIIYIYLDGSVDIYIYILYIYYIYYIYIYFIYIFSATPGPVEAEKPDVLLVKQGELLALFGASPQEVPKWGIYF